MNYKNFTTVGELKAILKDLPDDLIIVKREVTMEKNGYSKNNAVTLRNDLKEVTKRTWDRFDGEDYTYKTLEGGGGTISALEIL